MEIKVYETTNYSLFKRLEGNRDVKCVTRIIESIDRVGYIPSPICVNENYEVIDGQNRLEALKMQGLPVHYYIVEGLGVEEARSLNLGRTNWKPVDYVKSYAESGNKSYQMLNNLLTEHEGFSFQEVFGIVKHTIMESGWATKPISDGSFVMTQKEFKSANETIELIKQLKKVIKDMEGSKRVLVTAIGWCLQVEGCNKERLISVLLKKYPDMRPVVRAETVLQDIMRLYNASLKKAEKRIDFDVIYRNRNVQHDD